MIRQALEKSLRNELERTISKARVIAESAAREAIGQLCVAETAPGAHLDPAARDLRNKLRAHARALGDEHLAKPENGCDQRTEALVEEIAYEQWHRMIFARFLAENDLLMFDDGLGAPLAITLDEAAELAEELGAGSKWDLASECAAKMLPGVFRPDTLSFKVKFASDKVRGLEELLEGLATETFGASDSLGWIYQFWQKERKDAVNASEVKIGAKELAPVTQLFTENYMVSFLLDNTLGAWYAAPKLKGRQFATEQEARAAVSTEEIPLAYLRLVQDGTEWRPASGAFEKWPSSLSEFSMLDPANGSGHFLVATLLMLVPMRMELEGLDERTAIDKVLSENIHGLELDRRCVELAAFAVALEAWRYPNAGGYRKLPRLQIACDGIAPSGKRDEWLRLARRAARKQTGEEDKLVVEANDESLFEENLVRSMGALWDCFQQAPILGSLISPDLVGNDLWHQTDYNTLAEVLAEHLDNTTDEEKEASIAAQGIIQAMRLLGRKYTLVATNVPYLGRGQFSDVLGEFCDEHYSRSRADLATVFMERCLKFCQTPNGFVAIVLPQNWIFLRTTKKLREHILTCHRLSFLAQLNEGAFESSAAAGAFVILFGLWNTVDNSSDCFMGVDAITCKGVEGKIGALLNSSVRLLSQAKQRDNPDMRIMLAESSAEEIMEKYGVALVGLQTGDDPRYIIHHWEIGDWNSSVWELLQQTPCDPQHVNYVDGQTSLVRWEMGNGSLLNCSTSRPEQGLKAMGKPGIVIHRFRRFVPYYYARTRFHQNVAVYLPSNESELAAAWCYFESADYTNEIRKLDQKKNVTNATLVKVPFNIERWQKVAAEKYPNGLPEPFTNDPTQWIFHGHPCGSVVWDEETKRLKIGVDRVDSTVLHVVVARLLGYKWPSEIDKKMGLAAEMREVMKRNDALDDLVDDDGIVCIPSLNRELPAADRILAMLEAAYGDEWTGDTLGRLMESCGCEGMTLERWLRDRFFLSHAKLFGNRPFIWQIWDGLRDGFSVLVNYHKFGRKGLESLIYTYLGDWIEQQKRELAAGTEGAEEKLDAALALKGKLEKILEGEKPFDIFVRWKKLCDQPLGWEPDINDGVRLNIRPFCEAGVLRESAKKLNIKWEKDRGKDVDSAPWAKLFHNERINDHHLSLVEKKAARGL